MNDKYTLKEFRNAMKAKGFFEQSTELVIAELTRPKPEIGLGQVVWCEDDKVYDCWPDGLPPSTRQIRVLSLTEHGPAVMALRDNCNWFAEAAHVPDFVRGQMISDLAAFDAAMGDDDE